MGLAVWLGTMVATSAGSLGWAQTGSAERLSATPAVSGVFWTVIVPLLLFAVSFYAAYALYRHYSSK